MRAGTREAGRRRFGSPEGSLDGVPAPALANEPREEVGGGLPALEQVEADHVDCPWHVPPPRARGTSLRPVKKTGCALAAACAPGPPRNSRETAGRARVRGLATGRQLGAVRGGGEVPTPTPPRRGAVVRPACGASETKEVGALDGALFIRSERALHKSQAGPEARAGRCPGRLAHQSPRTSAGRAGRAGAGSAGGADRPWSGAAAVWRAASRPRTPCSRATSPSVAASHRTREPSESPPCWRPARLSIPLYAH